MRPRPATALILPALAALALLPIAASAAPAWEYPVADTDLTLSAKATPIKGGGAHAELSASIPAAVVTAWGEDCLPATRVDGSPNPHRGLPRGYRVQILVSRNGRAVPVKSIHEATGPLGDRLGVFPTPIGRSIVIKQRSLLRVSFDHPGRQSAEYRVTWLVDRRCAASITLCLPSGDVRDAPRSSDPVPEPEDTPDPEPIYETPAHTDPPPGGLIRDVVICRSVDDRGRPAGASDHFPSGTKSVCVVVGCASGEQAEISLTLSRGGRALSKQIVETDGRFSVEFQTSRAAGFQAGAYALTIASGGRTQYETTFTIAP